MTHLEQQYKRLQRIIRKLELRYQSYKKDRNIPKIVYYEGVLTRYRAQIADLTREYNELSQLIPGENRRLALDNVRRNEIQYGSDTEAKA